MIKYENIQEGTFLARPNRFLAHVVIDGREEICHVKNTGRCRELLQPGAAVWCQHHDDPTRKTSWSLITVQKGRRLVNIDSQVPNKLAFEYVRDGGLGFVPDLIKAEKTYGSSRFDLYYEAGERRGFVEVKGVTLEEDAVARFPTPPRSGAKSTCWSCSRRWKTAMRRGCCSCWPCRIWIRSSPIGPETRIFPKPCVKWQSTAFKSKPWNAP